MNCRAFGGDNVLEDDRFPTASLPPQLSFELFCRHRVTAIAAVHEMDVLAIARSFHVASHQRDFGAP